MLALAVVAGPLKNYKAEIEQLLPDDLIGAAEINRFMQAMQSASTASSSDASPAAASSA
jgi:hypothetical protein